MNTVLLVAQVLMAAVATLFRLEIKHSLWGYMNNLVSRSFIKKYKLDGISIEFVNMVFDDLIRLLHFIHISDHNRPSGYPFIFTSNIAYLDDLWHEFILHTRLYSNFCSESFGEYIHHDPIPRAVEGVHTVKDDLKLTVEIQLNNLELVLGQEFVNKIYFYYPLILREAGHYV